MTRVFVIALALVSLACASKDPSPKAGGEAKPDSKNDPKQAERICPMIGCSDAATISTKLTAAGAPLGKHEFTVEVDGMVLACSVEFTEATQIAHGTCSGDASLWLGPKLLTVEVPSNIEGVVSAQAEPIAGEFEWQLSLPGTPKKVRVVQTHANVALLDQTAEITSYTEFRPNGEGCEPVCKAARVEWTGP